MKNYLIKFTTILVLSLCFHNHIDAQADRPIEERIEAQRIAFITQRVNFTPQEAQVFWPIYNEYREKEKQIKNSRSDRVEILDMDEADAEIYVDKILSLEQQELDLKKQYFEKLKSVISSKKIIRFYAAERMFKERLLQAMNQRKNNARN
ncbi:MAG: hypothetical protein IPL46_11250 [Saprospiraceae bacterium]|nr:hypothetical protein [Saprospiraceae bacterium]